MNIEIESIKKAFLNTDYAYKFIMNNNLQFWMPYYEPQDETLLPTHWFDECLEIYLYEIISLPACQTNEKQSHQSLWFLQSFTKSQCKCKILWKTKKIKSLFNTEDNLNKCLVSYLLPLLVQLPI